MTRKYKVLIVDDSAVVRETLRTILNADPHLEVMAVAQDPYVAVERIRAEVPDVITLDVEMPRMDGLTFLRKIMSQRPIPVVMCSSLTENGCDTTLRALELGAVDIITKPKMGTKQFLEESALSICDAVRGAAMARVRKIASTPLVEPKLTADAVIARPVTRTTFQTTEKVIVIGASTGGTEALRIVLEAMPMDAPGIVIVQHMPEKFTAAFARRLDTLCSVTVKEAADNDTVVRGTALIAPGNRHTMLMRSGARYYVEVTDGPLVSRHRPSVDVLFRSAAQWAGPNAVGAILTGMGDDGAVGMAELHATGARTLAQDEASSVVFGMPNEAIKRGGVDHVVPLDRVAHELLRLAC